MKPVTVNKRTFKVKAILAAVLAGIMLILIVGYAFTKDMKPQRSKRESSRAIREMPLSA